MATKLTQTIINRATEDNEPGTQLYDADVSGLRVVVGKRGCSYKFVGRINDGTDRYVSVTVGRTDDVDPKAFPTTRPWRLTTRSPPLQRRWAARHLRHDLLHGEVVRSKPSRLETQLRQLVRDGLTAQLGGLGQFRERFVLLLDFVYRVSRLSGDRTLSPCNG